MRAILFLLPVLLSISLFSIHTEKKYPSPDLSRSFSLGGGADKKLCVAFYNVENLFDTIDDPNIDDAEFLPNGKNHWTGKKYQTKINHLARVLGALNADIVGLAEVENIGVVRDLVNDSQVKKMDYGIVHKESPDTRGIDVAMIYNKKEFKVLSQRSFHVDISQYEEKPTRDILLVKGVAGKSDTLFIFLNHWPSRRGGTKETEPRRQIAATVLKKAVDSIMLQNPSAKILIMGDFNDNPPDSSISQVLKATKVPDVNSKHSIYDAASNFNWKAGEGSEFYKGEWSRFIQIMLSSTLVKDDLDATGNFKDIYIFKRDWMMALDTTYSQMVPARTYEGNDKPMGYSDHLPVYVLLNL